MVTFLFRDGLVATRRSRDSQWRASSEELWRAYHRDFGPAIEAYRARFAETGQDHWLRVVAIVHRAARELGTLYAETPDRLWSDVDSAAGLPDAQQDFLRSLYRVTGTDQAMRTLHEHMVSTGNGLAIVVPDRAKRAWRLRPVAAHDVAFAMVGDPLDPEIGTLRLRVSVPGQIGTLWAYAEISAERAVWVDGPEDIRGRGLWSEDGSNPIGAIPLVHVRSFIPEPGEALSPAPDDLRLLQRAVLNTLTAQGEIALRQGFSQAVAVGDNLPAELGIGFETAVRLTPAAAGGGASFSWATPDPDLDGARATTRDFVELAVTALGLNANAFFGSSALTATAKQVELVDRDEERRRQHDEFERAEQAVYDYGSAWLRLLRPRPAGEPALPEARVSVTHRRPPAPIDPAHATNSVIAVIDRVASGVLTPAGGVASLVESLGMRREAATSIVDEVQVGAIEPVAPRAPGPLRVIGE